jgi:2-polyprenyl-6-methoxyphenol hydroxylase-like FAD-dependent oxidoreductase
MVVIRELGLIDAMTRIGFLPESGLHREYDTGEVTFDLRYDQFPDRYGAPHLILHRGDLQQILTSALQPETLELGKRLVSFKDTGRLDELAFDDGTNSTADIVIGADGINSRVREILLGPERPKFTGHVAHRSIFPSALLGDLQVGDCTKWWADDRYFLVYYLTSKRDEIYFVTGVPEPWRSEDYSPIATDMAQLRQHFRNFHPEVQGILSACPQASTWPILHRDPYPLWNRGRVVLLGDACHPMKPHMGQGAAMAIEDATILARCIEQSDGRDIERAFDLYARVRFRRTTRIKAQSDKHEWMRHGTPCDWVYGYNALTESLDVAEQVIPQ